MQGERDRAGEIQRKTVAAERHRLDAVVRLQSIRTGESPLNTQNISAGLDQPAGIPRRARSHAGRGIGGRAHVDLLTLPDCLRARELQVAQQAIDLGRRAVGRGDVAKGGYPDRQEQRDDADDDHKFD
jgi:hypothetical protein